MSRKPETKFRQDQVTPFLKTLKNSSYFPIQQLAIRGDADIILCIRGRFVWLELKKDKDEEPKKIQKFKAQWVQNTGGVALVAYPENWQEIKAKLRELDGGSHD